MFFSYLCYVLLMYICAHTCIQNRSFKVSFFFFSICACESVCWGTEEKCVFVCTKAAEAEEAAAQAQLAEAAAVHTYRTSQQSTLLKKLATCQLV